MKISTIILGIIFFALATMILYGWGMIKQSNQTGDLMKLLFGKGQGRINKYLKQKGSITIKEAEKLCEGLEARAPFSANKAVVKDTGDFVNQLLVYMVKTGQIEKRGAEYVRSDKKNTGTSRHSGGTKGRDC
ncbi:MAG: hypothetical protein Q4D60_02730 [Eubacteriales bacterium]|nr:hypothetical protein [Eubacteriales bacterium]